MPVAPLWCDLGCCSQIVVVLKLPRIPALVCRSLCYGHCAHPAQLPVCTGAGENSDFLIGDTDTSEKCQMFRN